MINLENIKTQPQTILFLYERGDRSVTERERDAAENTLELIDYLESVRKILGDLALAVYNLELKVQRLESKPKSSDPVAHHPV